VHEIRTEGRYGQALEATADLLSKLRLDAAFVGSVARSAWLGSRVERGSLDVIALMGPEQKNQVAMMASNRGFRVEREEIEASEELDLVPLNFVQPDGDVRVHVLVGSNALYGRMVAGRVQATAGERELGVARAEDLALLLAISEDEDSRRDFEKLARLPEFDRRAYNERLISIGLPQLAIPE
jgi:hypothetical protein